VASNQPAPEVPRETPSFGTATSFSTAPSYGGGSDRTWGAWSASGGTVTPIRGRHRVERQRGGLARSSTVLGVGVIAAVGAGGIATAQGKPPVSLSVPDTVADHIPDSAASLPFVGSFVKEVKGEDATQQFFDRAPLSTAGMTENDVKRGSTDAGEALRARILMQAQEQQQGADRAQEAAAEDAAAKQAAAAAGKQHAAADRQAKADAAKKAQAAKLAALAKSYTLPVASYTITGTFGEAGTLWASGFHTGLDFAAPTGTPIKAVHGGTVTAAGWAGSYGYRTVVKLSDGEELWYCHQSSMTVTVGQKVTTGEVIGRVGATGNVTGPHLHLEVRTVAGTAIDPKPWLEQHGLHP
jgi:murein DD-endopeptidase MepM/ murein hydrolase activator NlpD